MYVILVVGVVDWLLPSVQIPVFAWVLIILLWVCKGAVKEAKKHSAPEISHETSFPANDWIMSKTLPGVYSTADQDWAITVTGKEPDEHYVLWGEGDEENIRLSATSLGEAMDQADKIIAVIS
jgi:hypothetical protein